MPAVAILGPCLLLGSGLVAESPNTIAPSDIQLGVRLAPPQDRDAASWLQKAADAVQREDWKLAADTLARIIAEDGDKMVVAGGGQTYQSAREAALRQLAALPEEGLDTYCLLYDAEAKRLYDEALSGHSLRPLRAVARRYPLTSVGSQAIELLAARLIDLHQHGEALDLLNYLTSLPHQKTPMWRIRLMQATAFTYAGDREQASHALQHLLTETDFTADDGGGLDPSEMARRIEAVQRQFEATKRVEAPVVADSVPPSIQPAQTLMSASQPAATQPETPERAPPAGGTVNDSNLNIRIVPENPWLTPLPGSEAVDPNVIRELEEQWGRPAVWQPVADDRRVFVPSATGVLALDQVTFEPWWWAPAATAPAPFVARLQPFQQRTDRPDGPPQLDEISTRVLYHEYAGAVSTGFGCVYAIEQIGTANEEFPSRSGIAASNATMTPYRNENSITAFDAATGRPRWTRGRGGPTEDDLDQAHFYAPPVVVYDRLVAPYALQNGLYLAVIHPDGKLQRKVYLGNAQPGQLPLNGLLSPTAAGGVLYQPTGAGLFYALDAYDFSLRWFATYEQVQRSYTRDQQQLVTGLFYYQVDEWLSSPPVVAGDLVLLTPHDGDKLMAFDRRTGELRWTHPRRDHRYIVGADRQRVIIAGRRVTAVDLQSSQAAWSFDGRPCGRPVMAGSRVFVPTHEGLATLNAETGELTGAPQPTDPPLGNLVAAGGSLFSVSATHIAMHPDRQRVRLHAERELADNPNDPRPAVRLAWIETLDQHWQASLDLLDRAAAAVAAGTGELNRPASAGSAVPDVAGRGQAERKYAERIAEMRVKALLQLVQAAEPVEKSRLLARAADVAMAAADRINVALATCELRLAEGRVKEAFESCVHLAESTGNGSWSAGGDLTMRAWIPISECARRCWDAMNASDRATCNEVLASKVDASMIAGDTDSATRIADAFGFAPSGISADLALARRLAEIERPESSLYYARRAALRAGDSDAGAEALSLAARTALAPPEGVPPAMREGAWALERLGEKHAERRLPAYLCDAGAEGCLVRDFVARLKNGSAGLVLAEAREMPAIVEESSDLKPVIQDATVPGEPAVATFHSDDPRQRSALEGVVPLLISRRLMGIQAGSPGEPRTAWASELDAMSLPDEDASSAPRNNPHAAAVCGAAAMLNIDGLIYPVGLMSGRTLWRPLQTDSVAGALPSPPVVTMDDICIVASAPGTLLGILPREGAAPLWRRSFAGRRLGFLFRVGDRLLAVDQHAVVAAVLDPHTGRTLTEYNILVGGVNPATAIAALSNERPGASFAVAGMVLASAGEDRVEARDALTGVSLWTKTYTARVNDIHRLDDCHFAVTYGGDRFQVLAAGARDGVQASPDDKNHALTEAQVVCEVVASGFKLPPLEAALDGTGIAESASSPQRLLILVENPVNETTKMRYRLLCFDMQGQPAWLQPPPLWDLVTLNHRMLTASPGVIPVVEYEEEFRSPGRDENNIVVLNNRNIPNNLNNRNNPGNPQAKQKPVYVPSRLMFLDKVTSRRIGGLIDLRSPRFRGQGRLLSDVDKDTDRILDVILLDRTVILVSNLGYCVLVRPDAEEVLSSLDTGSWRKTEN